MHTEISRYDATASKDVLPNCSQIDTKARPESTLSFAPICDSWKLKAREDRRGRGEAESGGLLAFEKQSHRFVNVLLELFKCIAEGYDWRHQRYMRLRHTRY
jgi:hypothetical protein